MTSLSPISPTPGLVRRFAAILYDGLLLVALWFVATALLLAVSGGHLADPDRPLWLLYTLRASLLLVTLMFFAGFWANGGQTLGMRAWRLKLMNRDGGPVTGRQALARFAFACLSLAPAGLGYLWAAVGPEHLAWHDRLSGTHLILLPKNK